MNLRYKPAKLAAVLIALCLGFNTVAAEQSWTVNFNDTDIQQVIKFMADATGKTIIIDPKVVLYDEPTAGLDPFNTVKIQEMILRLKSKGVSSVFVTHDMPSAFAVCDRIALLMDGQIRAVGKIEDLKSDPNGYLQRFITGDLG